MTVLRIEPPRAMHWAPALASGLEPHDIPSRPGMASLLLRGVQRMPLSFVLVMFALPAGIIAAAIVLARRTRERAR